MKNLLFVFFFCLSSTALAAPACPTGQVPAQDGEHCCFYGQFWNPVRQHCAGTPSCPEGYEPRPDLGLPESCVAVARLKQECNSQYDPGCDHGYCYDRFGMTNVYGVEIAPGPVVLDEDRSIDLVTLSRREAERHGCQLNDLDSSQTRWCCYFF